MRAEILALIEGVGGGQRVLTLSQEFGLLGVPKDLDFKNPFILTDQFLRLWTELCKGRTEFVSAQILAGPSGIGKSHIAFLLALFSFGKGRPVLYIPDAGTLWRKRNRFITDRDVLLEVVVTKFFLENADVVDAKYRSTVTDWASFMRLLHGVEAVVVIDEQGHAYSQLHEEHEDPGQVFPLLVPNAYSGIHYQNIHFVLAGSNQAKFEVELNNSYEPFLRFVLPMSEGDAGLFVDACLGSSEGKHSLEEFKRFANFVPQEMRRFSKCATSEEYVDEARLKMRQKLKQTVDKKNSNLLGMLNDLFQLSSMAMGTSQISFLDLGFVYREKPNSKRLVAKPLCYPATLALLDLWREIQPDSKQRLVDARVSGDTFEMFVWDALLAHVFQANGFELKCRDLGYDIKNEEGHARLIPLQCDEYVISTIRDSNNGKGPEQFQKEVAVLKSRSQQRNVSIMYKCPTGSYCIDFIVLTATEDFPIQVSISNLTTHSAGGKEPDVGFLGRGQNLDGGRKCLRLNFKHFLFVTTKPEPHADIARLIDPQTSGGNLERWRSSAPLIRIVSAEEVFAV